MCGRLALLLVLLGGVVASPAHAATLPSSIFPLTGSTFQGGDGNQDDAPGTIDWQGLQGAQRVTPLPDDGLQFAGGSKENEPRDWDFVSEGSGVSPSSANLLDAWSSVEEQDGDVFLYLAFTREAAEGTTYLTFELNRDGKTWNNGHAEIPCRRTGDLLVALVIQGNSVSMLLQRWTTTEWDPDTTCAEKGTLASVASFPAGAAQGSPNRGPIVNWLPGTFALGSTITEAGQFAEAALNLTALLGVAFRETCFTFGSLWVHSRSSDADNAALKDYLAPQPIAARRCSASGVKFFDANADGIRQAGERGIPRFIVWADYDGDGELDRNVEPATQTDSNGRYVVADIRPPGGVYTLRETTLLRHRDAVGTAWRCSLPRAGTPGGGFADGPGGLFGCGYGPIKVADEPNANGRDFGNWLPARLTIRKRLFPGSDPARFAISVNGQTVLPAAGDGSTVTLRLFPGTYDISESAVPPAAGGDFNSRVFCTAGSSAPGEVRDGTEFVGLTVRGAAQARCTFVNIRPAVPAILIRKRGPTTATWGDTLRYTLEVANPSAVPLTGVEVTDPACDDEPVTGDADGTLNPGETWVYTCRRDTRVPAGGCEIGGVTNTATATGNGRGETVTDSASITTTLLCPDEPPEPPVPDPSPELEPDPGPITPQPGPRPPIPDTVLPDAIDPPIAGTAGAADFRVPSGCVSRASQLRLTGRRLASITVTVNRRHVSREQIRVLRRSTLPLARLVGTGRQRIVIRVTFERGSDTPSATLVRTVVVCAPRTSGPRFTG